MTAKGYLPGRTFGNTTEGGATGDSGGSYGGIGGVGQGATNAVYGDYTNPNELGSGGARKAGGGLVRLDVGGALQLDGTLAAEGERGGGGGGSGSGGGIYVSTSALTGGGSITAQGGNGITGGTAGGGGRVAVYAQDYSGFDIGRILAAGGRGGRDGGAGSVLISQSRPTISSSLTRLRL